MNMATTGKNSCRQPAKVIDVDQPGALTPAERLVVTAKAKATRAARHTMGPKQKAAISGATIAPATATTTQK